MMEIEKEKFKGLVEVAISSQVFEKDNWKLKARYKNEKNNYYALIKCTTCNNEKLVNYYNFINNKKHSTIGCDICRHKILALERVGKIYNNSIKVLNLDRIDYNEEKSHKTAIYYEVECLKCNKKSVRRFNSVQWEKTEGCKRCNSAFDSPSLNDLLRVYKDGAKSRNISWELTNEQFKDLVKKNCFYCDSGLTFRKHDPSVNKEKVNGIDRLDSFKSYNIDNCVPCCTMCNYMKQSSNTIEFLSQVTKIHNFQNQKSKKGSTTIETTSNDGKE